MFTDIHQKLYSESPTDLHYKLYYIKWGTHDILSFMNVLTKHHGHGPHSVSNAPLRDEGPTLWMGVGRQYTVYSFLLNWAVPKYFEGLSRRQNLTDSWRQIWVYTQSTIASYICSFRHTYIYYLMTTSKFRPNNKIKLVFKKLFFRQPLNIMLDHLLETFKCLHSAHS